jgi:hypothetical protein
MTDETLRYYVKVLKDAADAAVRSPQLSDDDKANLQEAAALLDDSINKLMKINQSHPLFVASPEPLPEADVRLVNSGPVHLWSALYATVTIILALGSTERRKLVEKMATERTTAAREGKRQKLANRDEVIWKHANRVQTDHPDWKRWRIAGEIVKPVCKELGRPLDRRTIDRSLRRREQAIVRLSV